MVLVESFCFAGPTQEVLSVKLQNPHNRLGSEEDVCDEAENAMYRDEVCSRVLVVLNDDQGGEKGENSSDVYGSVYISTLLLLLRCMGRLQEEDGFYNKEDAGRVE